MYSDFYDEKDDSDCNLGQRSISLVSELTQDVIFHTVRRGVSVR
jgi:hypothetical protein